VITGGKYFDKLVCNNDMNVQQADFEWVIAENLRLALCIKKSIQN